MGLEHFRFRGCRSEVEQGGFFLGKKPPYLPISVRSTKSKMLTPRPVLEAGRSGWLGREQRLQSTPADRRCAKAVCNLQSARSGWAGYVPQPNVAGCICVDADSSCFARGRTPRREAGRQRISVLSCPESLRRRCQKPAQIRSFFFRPNSVVPKQEQRRLGFKPHPTNFSCHQGWSRRP
jgi:hypothetical protein